jgi:hypothetical protein
MWLGAEPVFASEGKVAVHVRQLVASPSSVADDSSLAVRRPAIAN